MSKQVATEKKHSRYAPSAAHRWMVCPGSVTLCEKMPKVKSSEYAEEGTAAHKLAEICLKGGISPELYLGKEIAVEGSKRLFVVDEELVECIQLYIDTVNEDDDMDDYFGIEEPFDLSWLYPNIFGSNDFYRYKHEKKKLVIYDYKHGKNIIVQPEWNPQLLLYAIGAIKNICDKVGKPVFDAVIETVELVIVQPRGIHSDEKIRRWELKAMDLFFWAVNVARPCAIAVDTHKDKLVAGEHCHFCDAKAACPEIAKEACTLAQVAFDDVGSVELPHPDTMTGEMVRKVLQIAPVFSEWADGIKKYALQLLENGSKIPGYKLVKKRADRKWINEVEVKQTLSKFLSFEKMHTVKLLSVAQMEKIKSIPKGTLEDLWEKPETGYSIAPLSDRREEVAPSYQTAFADEEEQLSLPDVEDDFLI